MEKSLAGYSRAVVYVETGIGERDGVKGERIPELEGDVGAVTGALQ